MTMTIFKLMNVLIIVGTCLSACDNPAKAKVWEYDYEEDRLRGGVTTIARLESNENWFDRPNNPQMEMKIISGSADPNANGIILTSSGYTCIRPINVRVDDYPIEQVPGSESGPCLKIAPDSDLAQRIISAKEVVVELDGPGGPQLTFATNGLVLR